MPNTRLDRDCLCTKLKSAATLGYNYVFFVVNDCKLADDNIAMSVDYPTTTRAAPKLFAGISSTS